VGHRNDMMLRELSFNLLCTFMKRM